MSPLIFIVLLVEHLLIMYRGDELVSEATDRRGHPQLTLKRKGIESELCVSSIEQLDQILKLAGTKKVSETRICLEGILNNHLRTLSIFALKNRILF